MTSAEIIKLLNYWNGQDLTYMFRDLIATYSKENKRRYDLWENYRGDVPIKHREAVVEQKSNKKIAVPLRNHIIKQSIGYFLGNPIVYSVSEHDYTSTDAEKACEALENFTKLNKIQKKDLQLAEYVSTCGVGYRLCYIDTNGNERIQNIRPWECILIKDATLEEVQYGLIFYPVEVVVGTTKYIRTKIEWYDKENVTYYMENLGGVFELDSDYDVNPAPHMFSGHVPLIEFSNNTIQTGDFELVGNMIDEYDATMSDVANEVRDSAISTMIFKNCNITQADLDMAKKSGAISLKDGVGGNGADASYIEKFTNFDLISDHKKTLIQDIIIYSDSVDMADEKFSGGTQSGESRKWKLLSLENKTKVKEVEFTDSIRMMFDVIVSAWNKKQINLDADDIKLQFTRNLPVELATASDTNLKLVGTVSNKTRLSLLPFISNVEEELEQIELEKQADYAVNLDNIILQEQNADTLPDTNVDNKPNSKNTITDLQIIK